MIRVFITLLCFCFLVQAQDQVYIVKSGDTLAEIARTFDMSVAELVSINELANPDVIEIDQRLLIPSSHSWNEPLPAPFLEVSLNPRDAKQGQVQVLRVKLEPEAHVTVVFLGKDIPLSQVGDSLIAYLPTPVLQEVGNYSLLLRTQEENAVVLRLAVTLKAGNYETENIQLSGETSQLLDPAIVRKEHALMADTCALFEPVQKWSGAFSQPIAAPQFTSVFGTKRSYNNGPVSGFHRGQDYRATEGTNIYATANGSVSFAGELKLYGNTIILNHGLGVCSAYMHLSELAVQAEQTVQTGDLLGLAGATGLVTGAHLHFEVRVHGVPVSPMQWLEGID